MSDEIYQQAIKALARAGHGAGRLAAPTASACVDNPLCGDRIVADVDLAEGRIVALGHQTRGCLLCRAAASLLGRELVGRTIAEFAVAEAEIIALLDSKPGTAGRWPEFAIFAPVASHRSRHGCVLLPFRAIRTALASAASD